MKYSLAIIQSSTSLYFLSNLARQSPFRIETSYSTKSDQGCWKVSASKNWAYTKSGDVPSSETVSVTPAKLCWLGTFIDAYHDSVVLF